MIVMPNLFPVEVRMQCPRCTYESRLWVAENLGGLQWIEDAERNTHKALQPGCAGIPTLRVPVKENR